MALADTTTTYDDALRRDPEALIGYLRSRGVDAAMPPRKFSCPHPGHSDSDPSANLYQGADDVWRVKCFGCDIHEDIYGIQALLQDTPTAEVIPMTAAPPKPARRFPSVAKAAECVASECGPVEQINEYINPETDELDLLTVRYVDTKGKGFRQFHGEGEDVVEGGVPKGQSTPLFRRDLLLNAERVLLVEGEKCADVVNTAHVNGLRATTWPGGTNGTSRVNWTPLAGRRVWLWPDNDAGGFKAMDAAAKGLAQLDPAPTIHHIKPEALGLAEKEDVADWLPKQDDPAKALESVLATTSRAGADKLKARLDGVRTGKIRAIPWPWKDLSLMSKALLPGTITLLVGSAGASKSFMLLQALAYWHDEAVPAAVLEMEESVEFHLHRALAQRAGMACLTDDDWVRKHADEVAAIYESHELWMRSFCDCVHAPPQTGQTYEYVLEWAARMGAEGRRVIAIDPITVADPGKQQWVADRDLMNKLEHIATAHGSSVILVIHPAKGAKGIDLDDMAGGAAFSRKAQSVIALQYLPKPKRVHVSDGCTFGEDVEVNRIVWVKKARNSRWQGGQLGCNFNPETLCMEQAGIISSK